MAASDIDHPIAPLRWVGGADGHLVLLDQTRLPEHTEEMVCRDVESVVEAIGSLRVRGAPAIGIAAAYGMCLALGSTHPQDHQQHARRQLREAAQRLAASRPTAINLGWAVQRMLDRAEAALARSPTPQLETELLNEAQTIHEEDRRMCQAIGRHGAALLRHDAAVLTHCNAGALATSQLGTALALIYAAQRAGSVLHVYVDETRPLLQGSRLTAWELCQHGIPATVICDSAAAHLMKEGRVQSVITGADRIAANGDVANKIGTYGLALAAAAHAIPFYVAAPTSTFDLNVPDGQQIPIEVRSEEEITRPFGTRIAPEGVDAYNPAFDVTPAHLVTAIICERGVIQPVTPERVKTVVGRR